MLLIFFLALFKLILEYFVYVIVILDFYFFPGDLIHKHDSGITSPMEQGAAGGGTNTGNNDLMPLVEESAAGATSHPKSNSSPTSCNNQTLIDGGGGGGLQKRSSSTSGSSCNGSGSDSGQGSEADEQTVFKYQFHLPAYLAGKIFVNVEANL